MRARPAVVVFTLALSGCGWRGASPDAVYRDCQTLMRRGDMKAAIAKAEAGLRLEQSWRFRLLKAQVLLTSGEAVEAGRYLASLGAPPDAETRARRRMFEAQADYMQSKFAQSEAAIGDAAALAAPLHLPLLDAEIEYRRATLTLLRGERAKADPIYRHVLEIAEPGDPYLAANTMGNLGFMYMNASRCDQGIYWLERAREQFRRLGARLAYSKAVGNLGVCYLHLGDTEKAIAYYEEAERGSRESGNRHDQQLWLGNIATARLDQGQYRQAAAGFREVLGIALATGDKESAAWWLNNLTLASINLGDLDAAERYNRQTVELGLSSWSDYYRRVHEAEIAAARHDWPRAEKLFRAVLTLDSADPAPVLDAYSGLAEVSIQSGHADAAEAEFREAMALIERERSQLVREEYKLSYLASLMATYEKYVDFLVARGEIDRALEVAEASRARLLDEKLHAKQASPRVVTAGALRGLARSSGCVLLSYWLAPERSFVWSVTRDGVDLHVLPAEKKIAPLIDAYRSFIEGLRDPLDSEFPAGKDLSEILLDPVRERLSSGACVVLVPDRSLNSLNFETLPDPENASHYLIDRVTLSVAPSLGLIATAARVPEPPPSILLIGDPEPAVEEYPRLPHAAQEIAAIEHSVHRAQAFEGAGARPAVYRESHPETFAWIHFAAHASVNRESPLDSALILSRDGAGYTLSAREVMNVPLRASLVTLSACRSAGSKTYSGEGLVGLSWAFLRAGARSVVAGLWDVTDVSTANLMGDFYAELVTGARPARALRDAKLRMIHSAGAYRKPFYWGPFQLYTGAIAGSGW